MQDKMADMLGVQPDPRAHAFSPSDQDARQKPANKPEKPRNFDFRGVDSIGSSDPYNVVEGPSQTFTGNSDTTNNITLKQTANGFKICIHEKTEVPDDGASVFLNAAELKRLKKLLDEMTQAT